MNPTLGSLFDGAGGFPLAGEYAGITPIWASEIEPFPIRVTTKRFPEMQHLGNISHINGGEIPPVNIITFGNPCQELSVSNGSNRKGLAGERSGLFREAIRIIREMREATDGKYPNYIIWENVPGAFTSSGGEDFRQVLEEIAQTADRTVCIPRPLGGRWPSAGEIMGDGYSIAYRTYDAQFWGVPQRRRRIFLVADFGGRRAGKIQFEREGLLGSITPGRGRGQETAGETGNRADVASRGGVAAFAPGQSAAARSIAYSETATPTLKADAGGNTVPCVLTPWDRQSRRIFDDEGIAPTLSGCDGKGGRNPGGLISVNSGHQRRRPQMQPGREYGCGVHRK